mgnify:CR=1 FL=1|tara:strand:+ start:4124 stop:5071 length:948 start_codon:yes stop_codon:yes gene_type:complete
MRIQQLAPAAAAVATTLLTGGVAVCGVDGIFGIMGSTRDELADLLGVDEVPEVAASAVRLLDPLYVPLKSVSTSCTAGLFPEFNEVNDMNDCLLLPQRVVWRPNGAKPLLVQQTMSIGTMWQASTGSAVWGGGLALHEYLESLGPDFWSGQRVLELGTGTGLGGITTAKLGAAHVLVTDRDQSVLELAASNAARNLDAASAARFEAARLNWGDDVSSAGAVDIIIGADLTYNRDGWPALMKTFKALGRPMLLSASERRPNEFAELRAFLRDSGVSYKEIQSPFSRGYASDKVRIFSLDAFAEEVSADRVADIHRL